MRRNEAKCAALAGIQTWGDHPQAVKFSRRTLHDPRLAVCLREIQTLEKQREDEGASGRRDAFERLHEMRKFAVAQGNALALLDLLAALREDAASTRPGASGAAK